MGGETEIELLAEDYSLCVSLTESLGTAVSNSCLWRHLHFRLDGSDHFLQNTQVPSVVENGNNIDLHLTGSYLN